MFVICVCVFFVLLIFIVRFDTFAIIFLNLFNCCVCVFQSICAICNIFGGSNFHMCSMFALCVFSVDLGCTTNSCVVANLG